MMAKTTAQLKQDQRQRDAAALDRFARWVDMHIDIDAATVWNMELPQPVNWQDMLEWIRKEFGEETK